MNNHSVFIIRHGSTAYNSGPDQERIRGWVDIPLTAEGKREIHQIARVLRAIPFVKMYCSNLHRAEETVKIIEKTLNDFQNRKIPVLATQALRPWNLGDWQGTHYTPEVEQTLLEYQTTKMTTQVPGGEAFSRFLSRYLPFLRRTLREAEHDGPILMLTHTRNLRATDAWLNGGQKDDNIVDDTVFKKKKHLGTGEGLILSWNGSKWERKIIKSDGTISSKEDISGGNE